jgi:hypothetical protein
VQGLVIPNSEKGGANPTPEAKTNSTPEAKK